MVVSSRIKNFAMPLIFLSALLISMFFGVIIPYTVKSLFYATSLAIKELLIFSLPFIIFSLVFNSITKLGARAIKFILIIAPLICISNFTNTMLSYFSTMSFVAFGAISKIPVVESGNQTLYPLFEFHLQRIITNDVALISGLCLGLICSLLHHNIAKKTSVTLEKFTKYFFKILMPIMPLFIAGTALKLEHDGMLSIICTKYLPILLIFVISAYGFVILQYLILSKFNIKKCIFYIKNMAPAIITGFGSMSSAAALPLSITATEKNLSNKKNAGIIVPSVVNIHLVGDCFFIPMIALAIMLSFGMEFPGFVTYLMFSMHFVFAKFAVAAVPGGGVLVMLPILQNYLGFTPDMLGLITAVYVLFDPIITACNVAGNGAVALVFDKITNILGGNKHNAHTN